MSEHSGDNNFNPLLMGTAATPKETLGTTLEEEIRRAINRCNIENLSNTPDFILANYLFRCLEAFEMATKERERWYGVDLSINEPQSAAGTLVRTMPLTLTPLVSEIEEEKKP